MTGGAGAARARREHRRAGARRSTATMSRPSTPRPRASSREVRARRGSALAARGDVPVQGTRVRRSRRVPRRGGSRARARIRSADARARASCVARGVAADDIDAIDAAAKAEIDAAHGAGRSRALARSGDRVHRRPEHGRRPMALMNYSQAAATALSEAMHADPQRRRARRGPRPRRHLRAVPRAAAGVRRRPRHRHADLGGDDHGRRGRHGARGPAARWSRCASSTSRCARWTNSSTRRRRTASCSAARAACRWSCGMPIGLWTASAAQHSQSLEAWFAHIPGLVVVAPAAPDDNYGLLASALASGDPVVYMEHKELWGRRRRRRVRHARAARAGARVCATAATSRS